MGRCLFAALVAASAMTLAGCGSQTPSPAADGKLRIVATTGMCGDMATRVGGARVTVETLMGPGVDPHLYKATAGDVGRLAKANLVVYNGLHLEASMGDVLGQLGGRAVAIGEKLPQDRLIAAADEPGLHDPHVWFDVELWSMTAPAVAEALAAIDPEHAEDYRKNSDTYASELRALHAEAKDRIASIPEGQRVLVTAHDAFHYFGRAYGVEVRGLQGISTAAEAGAADVEELAAFIAERRIPAIFVESSVPPRTIESVRQAVKSRGWEVLLGGELFSDAMGDTATPEGTYVGMVRHNVDTMVKALGGAGKTGP